MLAYLVSNCSERRLGKIEFIRTGDEVALVCYKLQLRHSAVGTKEIHKNIGHYRRIPRQNSGLGPPENQAQVCYARGDQCPNTCYIAVHPHER